MEEFSALGSQPAGAYDRRAELGHGLEARWDVIDSIHRHISA